jgi:hypothetical protein
MNALVVVLPPLNHITFSYESDDGSLRAWDVTRGNEIARNHPLQTFRPAQFDMTPEWINQNYKELDWEYAKTTDLSNPLLVIPFSDEEILLIDGWHRLARAVMEGVEELPMVLLTQEEADSIQWLHLPPEYSGMTENTQSR